MIKEKFKKAVIVPVTIAALLAVSAGGLMYAGTADAATTSTTANSTTLGGNWGAGFHGSRKGHGISGTVSAINGDSITVNGTTHGNSTTGTTPVVYTVDATNAKIVKIVSNTSGTTPIAPATITISGINVGDTVMIQGTVSGTSVTATQITDGTFPARVPPAATGTVSAISGSAITLTSKNGTTYSVDASNATIMKAPTASQTTTGTTPTRPTPTTITVADIQVGDTLMVQGTTSGTSITATSIFDGVFGGQGHDSFSGSQETGKGTPRIGGTVTAINGDSITVSSTHRNSSTGSTPVVYTVDAANATISKSAAKGVAPTTISVSGINVGDTIMVTGTISGTSVTATTIRDGLFMGGHRGTTTTTSTVASQ